MSVQEDGELVERVTAWVVEHRGGTLEGLLDHLGLHRSVENAARVAQLFRSAQVGQSRTGRLWHREEHPDVAYWFDREGAGYPPGHPCGRGEFIWGRHIVTYLGLSRASIVRRLP